MRQARVKYLEEMAKLFDRKSKECEKKGRHNAAHKYSTYYFETTKKLIDLM